MKVLFVDDEPRVLEALERSLGLMVDDDDRLEFVEGGADALELLANDSYDAVVTDMRMPGIDGAELLQRARTIAPRAVRIVLSGQIESRDTLRALEHAHQILRKPCSATTLLDVLRASLRFRGLLTDEGFRGAVVALERLPAASTSFHLLRAELERGDASLVRVADIIVRDPGLAARVIQVASSPCFGTGRPTSDIRVATTRLGLQVVSALATASVFETAGPVSHELDLAGLAEASYRTASIAATLASASTGDAYLAGLLVDVGMIVQSIVRPYEFDAARRRARAAGTPFVEHEQELCHVRHAEVGAYLLALWGLPSAVVDAVLGHHAPELVCTDDRRLARVLAIACAVAAGDEVDAETRARAGIDERAFADATALC